MPVSTPKNPWHLSKYLLVSAALILGGCASTQQTTHHDKNTDRARQLSKTSSDPLGAYLANGLKSNNTYPFNEAPAAVGLAGTALKQLGIRYKLGGGTPDTGFDCSGLVIYAAEKSLGLKLPRKSAEIAQTGTPVKNSELKKGDLVFFNTLGKRFSHVGIYLGDRKFVHAPRSGSVVRIENMDIAYWKKRYNGARRLSEDNKFEQLLAASSQTP